MLLIEIKLATRLPFIHRIPYTVTFCTFEFILPERTT